MNAPDRRLVPPEGTAAASGAEASLASDGQSVPTGAAGWLHAEAILTLTPERRICSASAAAWRILDAAEALVVAEGRLVALRPSDERRLERAIGMLAAASPALDGTACVGLALPRRSGLPDYVLLLARAEFRGDVEQDLAGTESVSCIVAVIHDVDARPPLPAQLLQQCFGLTLAEAGVAAQLAAGRTPNHVALALAVSLNTVRTHLRAIYRKTGTSGQVDLAWRIAAVGTAAAMAAAAAALDRAAIPTSSKWTRRGISQQAGRRTDPGSLSRGVNQ